MCWTEPEPRSRLLKSLGLEEEEGLDRALSESRTKGELFSLFIMERSEPCSGGTERTERKEQEQMLIHTEL